MIRVGIYGFGQIAHDHLKTYCENEAKGGAGAEDRRKGCGMDSRFIEARPIERELYSKSRPKGTERTGGISQEYDQRACKGIKPFTESA